MPNILWRPEMPVRRTLEYSTDVITAHDGTEQRVSRNQRPRVGVSLAWFLATTPLVREMRTRLFQDMNSTWSIPTWWHPDRLTADHAASTAAFSFNADGETLLLDGDTFVVIGPDGTSEVLTVLTTSGTSLTSTTNTTNAYPRGSEVFRVVDGTLRDSPSLQRFRGGGAIGFYEVLNATLDLPTESRASSTLTTHAPTGGTSLRVLDAHRPLADEPTQYAVDGQLERIDFGGEIVQFQGPGNAFFVENREYSLKGRAAINYMDTLLQDSVGGRKPWYCPTYRPDLVVDTQPIAPWTSFDIVDESDTPAGTFDYAGQWFGSGYDNLRIKTSTGTELYRRVSTAVDNADGTVTLTLADALPASTVISEISFLETVRLGIDAVTYEHRGWDARVRMVTKVTEAA